MPLTASERATVQFYEWERRGRGWDMYDSPVQLEPRYYPLLRQPSPYDVLDDGQRPTLFSRLYDTFFGRSVVVQEPEHDEEHVPDAFDFHDIHGLSVFHVSLPKGHKIGSIESEQLLVMFSYCSHPVSFEIIASEQSIILQLVCRNVDASICKSQLQAFFPASSITEQKDILEDALNNHSVHAYIDFGLGEEFMRPLLTAKSFELDPFMGLFGMFDQLDKGEYAVYQVLFSGTVNSWSKSILDAVVCSDGSSFFRDAPEMVALAKEKVSHPLFGVTVRIVAGGRYYDRAEQIANSLAFAVTQQSKSEWNTLIPLSDASYKHDLYREDILHRRSRRLGMLLNSRELTTFVHFPAPSITAAKLQRSRSVSKSVAEALTGHEHFIGMNVHQGSEKQVSVSLAHRMLHTHIIGATGTGKSTFMLQSILQDITHGYGCALFDPHGDIAEQVIAHIPKDRAQDVIVIDPTDTEYPVALNILSAYSDTEKEVLASDLVAIFKRLSTSWGDQMNSVFANAILAMVESRSGGTLIDLRRFLIEASFRDTFLQTVEDPHIQYYWKKEFPLLKSSSIAPILTRLDMFLRPKPIRNMVAQKQGLQWDMVLDTNKIVIVKLSQGLIGAENSYLLGSMLLSKLHQVAMGRQSVHTEKRSPFFIYIDEFQHFISPSLSAMLSGVRKYKIGLTLAHQDMQQVVQYDSELANALLTNAGIRMCFRIGEADAKKMESGFMSFRSEDFLNLGKGEAIIRVERSDQDCNIAVPPFFPSSNVPLVAKEQVLQYSRSTYGTSQKVQIGYLPTQRNDSPIINTIPVQTEKKRKEIETVSIEKKPTQHRYLQMLIKRMAENRGYTATIEQVTPQGNGRVDVLLEKGGKYIACEVSVSTSAAWESHNVQKCLLAGYETIVVCSTDSKHLIAIRQQIVSHISRSDQDRILICGPAELFHFMDSEVMPETTEVRTKGYRVKVTCDPVSLNGMARKRDTVAHVVLSSLKKLKNN